MRDLKAVRAREASEREEIEQVALRDSASALRDKFNALPMNLPGSQEELPCAAFRKAVMACYEMHGRGDPITCAPQVKLFTECAQQVSRLSK